jgi:dTDP-4-amino-4,6-dideoxygalactose transaminase
MPALLSEIDQILRSGRFILGPRTQRFEEMFRDYVGTSHAVAVSTCSAALQIVLRYHGVEGREVIVPTNGFPGALSPILYENGIPVLAEMDEQTFCMDVEDALSRVTRKTAGFIVTHIAGMIQPGLDELRHFCEREGLFLIEDASHAHGASIRGRKVGTLTDAACFSFYPTKIMTSLTGGMITTESKELAELARSLRHHGQGQRRNEFIHLASDWCISEIHAAVGICQLGELDEQVSHRNRVVQRYREKLGHLNWITIPEHGEEIVHAYYKLPTLLDARIDRDKLQQKLEVGCGIQNGTVYDPPCHLQPVHRERFGGRPGMFPVAERALARQFCPPVHAAVSEDDVDYVVEMLTACIEDCWKPGGS